MKKRTRGMTLIEAAIVMGVVGIVLGAVWVASSSVRERQQTEEAIQTITEIADRVRAVYRSYPGIKTVPTTAAAQIAADLLPAQAIKNDTTTQNGWGGEVKIGFKRYNDWIVGFSVMMSLSSDLKIDVRDRACMDVLSRLRPAGTSQTGYETSNGVPVPSAYPLPARDNAPDAGPIYAYAGSGGWENVSNKNLSDTVSAFGSSGCRQIAFYFKL